MFGVRRLESFFPLRNPGILSALFKGNPNLVTPRGVAVLVHKILLSIPEVLLRFIRLRLLPLLS
jgi:hypothetical protein